MRERRVAPLGAVAVGLMLTGTLALSQSPPPTQGPADGAAPAWFLQGSFPDPGGRTVVEPGGHVTISSGGGGSGGGRGTVPPCSRSPLCGRRGGVSRQALQRVQWKQTLGYRFEYPYVLPP